MQFESLKAVKPRQIPFHLLVILAVFLTGAPQLTSASEGKCRTTNKPLSVFIDIGEYYDQLAEKNSSEQRTALNLEDWINTDTQSENEGKSCQDSYSRLLDDHRVNITFAFGYFDTIDRTNKTIVIDNWFLWNIYQALTRKCENPKSTLCGFRTVEARPPTKWVLEKELLQRKDGNDIWVTYSITIVRSSADRDDSKNVTKEGPTAHQKELTSIAEEAFFGGIRGDASRPCEVCVYLGHARLGGGPDFTPVPHSWRKRDQHPNYSIYQKHRPGYRKMLQSFEESTDKPKLLALFGCDSHQRFWRERICLNKTGRCQRASLKRFAKDTGFLLSNEWTCSQNGGGLIATVLDTVINMKCRSALNSNLDWFRARPAIVREDYVLEGNFL